MEDQFPDRLRQHPGERFAAPQHPFDLAAAAARLRHEAQPGKPGHRQLSLYKAGPTSVSLFLFDPGAGLPPHRTKGIVSIHVLKGRLRVVAEGQTHDLRAGHLLVMAAAVQHDVSAQDETEMLLTVSLDPAVPPAL
jgi:quercetin dioxygenase-like cupin family protein